MDERPVQGDRPAGRGPAQDRRSLGYASGGAAEAARAAVDLEPDLAAASVAVDTPPARELREQAQAEALGLDRVGIEPRQWAEGEDHDPPFLRETLGPQLKIRGAVLDTVAGWRETRRTTTWVVLKRYT